MIVIRAYQKEDYPHVAALLRQAQMFDTVWDSEENFAGMIEKDPEAFAVATVDNNVVGNIIISPFGPKTSHFFRLAVRKDYRNQGIGSQLLEYAENILRKRGVVEVALFADANNKDLQSFYAKKGFKHSGKPHFCMWKELT